MTAAKGPTAPAAALPTLADLTRVSGTALPQMRAALAQRGIGLHTGARDDVRAGSAACWRVVDANGSPALSLAAMAEHWQRPPWTLSITLLQLQPGGGALTLEQARIGTRCGWRQLRAQAALAVALLLRRHLAAPQPPDATSAGWAEAPRRGWLTPLWRLPLGCLRRSAQRWHERLTEEWWTIGIIDRPAAMLVEARSLGAARWLEARPAAAYLADPFVWRAGDRVLCEEYPLPDGPGRLRQLRWDGAGGLLRDAVVMPSALHMSYPGVTETADGVWLLPETGAAGRAAIQRLAADGSVIELACVAEGRALADPTLFAAEGRFWIAYTDAAIGLHDNLCLMSAPDLHGPWLDDPRNPVKLDITSSRPAGAVLRVGAALYRPAQDCAAGYGAALTFNRIDRLSGGFAETVSGRLAPDPRGPFPHGLHSFADAGDRVLIDGKRLVWRPARLWRGLRRRLRQLALAISGASSPGVGMGAVP